MQDIRIGSDTYGKQLFYGDICKYKIKGQNGIIKEYRGMIFYDDSEYSFAFEQLDDDFPVVLMNKVETNTIDKIISAGGMTDSFPNYNKWKEIYNNNLGILK